MKFAAKVRKKIFIFARIKGLLSTYFILNTNLSYNINVKGRLIDLGEPQVMGILNVTPDSFYSGSRKQTDEDITERVRQIIDEGGTMIDIGAYSSRPGADNVSEQEEMQRLSHGMRLLRAVSPDIPVSVDTFRASVAKMAVEELGADIINDISGGELDKDMMATVAKLQVPYILMHMKVQSDSKADNSSFSRQNMQQTPHYDHLMKEIMMYFAEKVQRLRDLGQKDIILDPGFGFSKTLEHNYELLCHMEELQLFNLPVLSGISRKSMIYKLLGTSPDEALNGTTVLNTISLQKGASILRVHDVREAVETVRIVQAMRQNQ